MGLFGWHIPMPDAVAALALSLGMAFRGFDNTAGQAASCLINAGLLIVLLWRAPPNLAFWRAVRPVLCLIAAAICWATLVTLQRDWTLPDYSVGKLLSLFSGAAALMGGALLADGRHRRRSLIDWLLTINCAILVIGLILRPYGGAGMLADWPMDRDGRYLGLIGNANVTAAMAGSVAIMAFGRMTGSENRLVWAFGLPGGHILTVPMFAVGLGVVILTASRFTVAALMLILSLFVINWLFRWGALTYRRLTAGLVGVAALIILSQFSDVLRDRFTLMSSGFREREAIWSHLSDVAGQSAFIGYGLGSFSTINAHFLDSPRYAQATWTINSPHDLVLQLVLQAGWPYALLLFAAGIVVGLQVIGARNGRWSQEDGIALGVTGLIMSCAMVDVVLDMPCAVTLMLFLVGQLWGHRLEGAEVSIALSRLNPANHIRLVRR